MKAQYQQLIEQLYEGFNARNIDAVLLLLDNEVDWPKRWEGGYVHGHDEVRDYWTRQWKEINPKVEPVSITENGAGQTEVEVHQIAKDLQGNVLFDGIVHHIYTFKEGKIKRMEIKNVVA